MDHSPIGLSDEQQYELRQLYRSLAHLQSPSLEDREAYRRVCLDRILFFYVEFLCYDVQVEAGKLRKRKTANDRRKLLAEMNKLYGRELSPDDLVKELAKHAPVPRFAKDAIRRDYLRITV